MALSFNHAMIYSRDVAKALWFYVDLLGFRLIETYEHGGKAVYARLRAPVGESTIALHALERGQTMGDGGLRLYFEVRNLDRFCAKLASAGVKFMQLPKLMRWGWKHAYLKDPDGHELSLYWAGKARLKPRAG
ncbi:MAG: VOC family protein [Acidimicrobiia bacterium]|nr:VOC family protein [Acidimicrobiia bacterium]